MSFPGAKLRGPFGVVLALALGVGAIFFVGILRRQGQGHTLAKPSRPEQPTPKQENSGIAAASPKPRYAGSTPGPSTSAQIDGLMSRIQTASELDTPDELIDAIMALGRLLRDPARRAETQTYLRERLEWKTSDRLRMAVALVLPVYAAPPHDIIQSLLSRATRKLESARGLIMSLTLGQLPSDWDETTERRFWGELFLTVPGVAPKYQARVQAERRASESEEVIPGTSERTGGLGVALNTLNRFPRSPIGDKASVRAVLDYVLLSDDVILASEVYAWFRFDGGEGISEILNACRRASSEEMKQVLAKHLGAIRRGDEQTLSAWYMEERNPRVRQEIACTLIGLSPSNAMSWFEWLQTAERSEEIHRRLIDKVSSIKSPEVVRRLGQLATAGPAEQRKSALWSLSNAHRTYEIEFKASIFLSVVQDPDPDIRNAAVEGLQRVTGRRHAELFRQMSTSDPSVVVRSTANRILAEQNDR